MPRTLNTAATAPGRVAELNQQGHTLDLFGDRNYATVVIHRADGQDHQITITPDDLSPLTRVGLPFARYPQPILITRALHAIADWSAAQDRRDIIERGTTRWDWVKR